MANQLSHLDAQGSVTMVDVGEKPITKRRAIAEAYVRLSKETMSLLQQKALPKGDALVCARIGAIMAAKQTCHLIPLCHNINLTFLDVRFEVDSEQSIIRIESEAQALATTGVEMEAIVAAQMAATIIYDMCKAVQKDIVITDIKLLAKSGGRSGQYTAPGFNPC
ncbi:MAG: cyclic pyranopterin monophosphate synthase MoaC [Desulfovibrionaceae bacterium]|nr:cyclic pyranopterin monophosphate synthase MoaC [Desulfovibrionaceae bacterium]